MNIKDLLGGVPRQREDFLWAKGDAVEIFTTW